MINRQIPPKITKGEFAGMNPTFGNDISGNIDKNSRITYPGTAAIDTNGEDAWLNGPERIQTQQATANPQYMGAGSDLSAVAFSQALAKKSGMSSNIPAGDTSGGTYF